MRLRFILSYRTKFKHLKMIKTFCSLFPTLQSYLPLLSTMCPPEYMLHNSHAGLYPSIVWFFYIPRYLKVIPIALNALPSFALQFLPTCQDQAKISSSKAFSELGRVNHSHSSVLRALCTELCCTHWVMMLLLIFHKLHI